MPTTMIKLSLLLIAAALAATPAPGLAQAGSFTVVNATPFDMSGLMVRRFGTGEWLPLVVTAPPKAGGRAAADFSNEDCAFDLRATLPDGRTIVWPGVNLCQVKVVTLNQKAGGALWVDYE